MYFNEYFNVSVDKLDKYGALNISLDCDLPLFIDPLLIFISNNLLFKSWHEKLVKYILFLSSLKKTGQPPKDIIRSYFTFKEIRNNWLGLSKTGNRGSAIGNYYGESLYKNIENVIETHSISKSIHFEKLCLFEDGVGKDKISDFVTNILLNEFAKYTETFATKYIDDNMLSTFMIEKADFNFVLNQFVPRKYKLPFIVNHRGIHEFVLLTPKEILRVDENAINKTNLYNYFDDVVKTIENEELRFRITSYLNKVVEDLNNEKKQINKLPTTKEIVATRKRAIDNLVSEYPKILDYFIKLQENSEHIIHAEALNELKRIEQLYIYNVKQLASGYKNIVKEHKTSFDESLYRINFLKNQIEECGLWKNLYIDGKPIAREQDIQRLFKLVWCQTSYDFNAEVNNGNGPVDFKVSLGSKDKTIVEFKLAKKIKFNNVFAQTDAYEKANITTNTIVVIFYFSQKEQEAVENYVNQYNGGKEIVLIDCRNDNKKSASKRTQHYKDNCENREV